MSSRLRVSWTTKVLPPVGTIQRKRRRDSTIRRTESTRRVPISTRWTKTQWYRCGPSTTTASSSKRWRPLPMVLDRHITPSAAGSAIRTSSPAAQARWPSTGPGHVNGEFFESLGGSLIQSRATHPDIVERVPPTTMSGPSGSRRTRWERVSSKRLRTAPSWTSATGSRGHARHCRSRCRCLKPVAQPGLAASAGRTSTRASNRSPRMPI